MNRSNRSDHIRLTSHPEPGAKSHFPIHWGAKTARERGPIIGTVSRPQDRNVIGSHGGSYAVYRALAVSSGALDPIRREGLAVVVEGNFDVLALHEAGGPARCRELQRRVAPITQKELTKRLRDLERSGLVARRVYAEVPPRVEYRLTELGLTLMPALTGLHEWAERYGAAVDEHWRRGAAGGADRPEER